MKRILLFIIVSCLAIAAKAQTLASGYNWSQSTGTYTALSGASTAISGAWNDNQVSGIALGFTFNYLGSNFTTVSINSNGWIAFGTVTTTTTTYTPISALLAATNGCVSASGCNLQASAASDAITYLTTGSSGSRIFTVEYKNVRFNTSATGESWNFQIKLYETSNIIQIVYGSASTPTTTRTMQVGIRGTAITDFNTRLTTTNWSATTTGGQTSTCTRSTSVQPASGLTYTWCPNAAQPTVSVSPTAGCSSYSPTASGASTYTWSPATGLSATTGASPTVSNTVGSTYEITGLASNGCAAKAWTTAKYFVPTATSISNSICPVDTTTLTGAIPNTYYVSNISYALSSTAGFTAGPSGDDVSAAATIPFTFNYFGTNYTSVNICTNGFINFGTASTSNAAGLALPNATQPASIIALFCHDMNTGSGSISYGTIGSTPNRVFVVSFNSYGDFSGTGTNTGQIKLYETSNLIECHIAQATSTAASTRTCGIQNAAQNVGYNAPSRNGGVWYTSNAEAWRFTPYLYDAPTYSWSPSAGLSSSTAISPVATVSTTTTYTLTATAGSCSYTATKTITAFTLPTVAISPTNACYGINMVASGATTYAWTPATGLSATTGATVNPTPGSATTYTVTGTDSHGCKGTATKTVNLLPTVGISHSGTTYCSGGSPVTLTSTGTATIYAWTPSATLSSSTAAAVNATPTTTVTYTLTGTDGNGCSSRATQAINGYVGLTGIVPYVPSDTVICFPGYALMTEGGTGGTWSSSDAAVFTIDAGGGVYPVAPGTAMVYYTSPCGTDSLSVRVAGGGFTLTASPSMSTYCSSGSPVSITVTSTDAGTDTWLWTDISGGAPIGLSSTSTPTSNASPSVSAVYAIFGTNSTTGCHAVVTDTVINNTPAAITGTNTVCVGSTRTYADATGGGTWSSSATGIATVNSGTGVITGVAAGSATITYTVTATGCYVIRAITVNALPTLAFTPSSALACGGIGVAVTASGAVSYTWAPNTALSATTGATVTANPGSSTTYTITGTDANGCVNTGTKTVGTGANYMAAFISPAADTVCPGGTDVLTGQVAASATSYTVSSIAYTSFSTAGFTAGPSGDDAVTTGIAIPFTFNYFGVNYSTLNINTNGYVNFGGTSTTTGYPGTAMPNATNPAGTVALFLHDMNTGGGSINYGTIGTTPNRKFVISYNAYGDFTGTGVNTGQIVLYESSNIIECHVNTTTSTNAYTKVCGIQNIAQTIGYNATSRNGVVYNITTPEAWRFQPSFPSATYAWAGATTSASTGTPVTATVSGTQTYTVTVTDPASGCNASFSKTIYNYTNPTVTVGPATVCVGTTMTASGAVSYTWAPTTGLSSTNTAATVTSSYAIPTYTVTGTDAHGCIGTATKNISTPTISVSPSSTIFCSAGAAVGLTASGTSVSYAWSPAAGLSATTGASVNASPTVTTVYTVIGTDATGCSGLATATVNYNVTPTTITGASTICLPGTTTLTSDGTGGVWSSSDTTVATVVSSGLVTGVSAGTCTISYGNPTCGYATFALTVANGGFTVTTTPGSGTYCASGSALSITALDGGAGASFVWSPASGLSATTGATVTASPTITTTYTVTGTAGACSNSTTITVSNNTPAAIAGGVTAICAGSTTTWTDATGGGTWSTSASGTASVNSGTGVITGVAAGSATITYTVTATGCYVTRGITVNALPTLSFTPAAAFACGGIGVTVTASGAVSYSWAPNTALSATTGASVTANPGASTTYTITGTDANGCVNTGTKTVGFGANYMAAFISPAADTVCPGGTDVLTGQVAASATSYTVSSIAYTSFSTAGFTAGPSGDDAVTTGIAIPFTFNYFGVNYSTLNINTNGYVNFGGTSTTTGYPGTAMPNATNPAGTVALFLHDMNTGGGSINYGTIGTTPNRKFVISYNAYGDFTGTGVNTGQIVLYESSNIIECHVNTTTSTTAYTKVCGIQNIAQTIGYNATSRNGVVYNVTTPEAWRFQPSFPSATYAWAGATTSASTGTPVTATVSGTQTYTVTVTDPASGCNASFSKTIYNYNNPTVTIGPATVCVGTTMTASGAVSYTWAPTTGLSSTNTAATVTSSYAIPTYTVTGTDAHGCIGTATKNISTPTISVSPSSTIFCSAGAAVGLTASGTSVSYSWSPAAGLSATTGASVNASPTVTTVYTVIGTDATGCSGPATSTVTYNVTPTTVSGTATICLPGTTALTTDGTGGNWISSDTTIATVASSGLVTGVGAGTCTISYVNATCGYATLALTVSSGGFTVTTTPGSGTYCASGSALSITALDGGAGATFAWAPATGLSATTGATVAASPTVTTSYTVTGTAGICTNSAVIVVTNNTPAAISGSTAVCTGLSTPYTDATAGGTWSSSAPTVASVDASTGTVYGLTAGTANITYTVTATGCYAVRGITVNTTPTLSFTPSSAAACGGIAVAVTASGASTYVWSPATGLSATTGATVSANPTITTTYTITGTSAAGCVATGTKTVGVSSVLITSYALAAPTTVCPGGTTTLTAGISSSTTTYSSNTITYSPYSTTGFATATTGDDANSGALTIPFTFNFYGVNYSSIYVCTNGWVSFGGGGATSTNLGNNVLPSTTAATTMGPLISMGMHDMNTGGGSITYGTIGTTPNRKFVISWNAYGDFSCGGTNTGQIVLNETTNAVDLLVGSLSGTCNNTVGIQNAAGTIASTFTSPTINGTTGAIGSLPAAMRFAPSFPSATYAWTPASGVTSTTATTTTATVASTTVYTVTATDPASGCNGSFTTTVNTFTPPTVTIAPSVVCSGTPMTASGASTYTWGPASGLSSTNTATTTPTPTVVTTYTVTGTDTNGCVATATKTISFPTISLTPTSAIYCSSGSGVGITASGTGVSYSWAPSAGLSAVTGTTSTATPTVTTIYTVTASDASGCVNTARDTITYNIATSGISGPSSTLCLPGTMLLTEAGTGGSWSSSDTTLAVVNSSGLVTGITAGSYTITYNNVVCGGFATYSLTNVSGGFTVSVTPSTGTYCSTGSALNATASGGTTYSWLPTAGLDVTTGATVNASPTVTTVYTVTGTTGGCSNSATLTVTNNTPAPIAGGVTTLCSAGAGALSTTTTTWTDATGGGSWSSSNTGVATITSGGVITGVAAGTATITYNVSGCYVTRNININATPAVSFTPTLAAACAGTGVVVTASGASTYTWTPASGLSSTVSASPTATPTITTTYTVIGTSAAGCQVQTTKTVNVSGTAMLAYATSTPTQVCTGGVTTLTGSVAASTVYTSASTGYNLLSTAGFTAGPTGDDNNSGAISLPFTFNYFGTNYSNIFICTNGWVSFTSSSTNLANYALPSATAATAMGPLIAMGMHDMNTGSGTISYGTVGTAPNRKFVVSYNAYGDFSCGGTNTGQIILYESSNVVDLLVGSLSGTCNNTVGIQNAAGTTAYTATSPTINGTAGAIGSLPAAYRYTPSFPSATYAWTPTSGVTSTAAATTTATVTATTTYTVTVTDPATGCNGSYTTTDTAVAQPTVTVTTSRTDFCSGGQDSLIATPSGGVGPITSYTWSGPGLSATTGSVPNASFTPTTATTTSGSYTVSVAYAGSGCNNATNTTATVTLNSDPVVTVSPSTTSLCVGNNLILTESLTSGGSGTPTYSWSGPGITTTTGSSSTSPTFTPSVSTGAYSVAVTYSGVGCDVARANTGTVTVNPIPGITLGANPSICQPTASANISYSSPVGSPTNYSIVWGATALTDGFTNVTGASLPASPISLTIPSTSISGVYTGSVTVTNAGSCTSATSYPFTLTVYAYPTASIASVTPPCSGYATTVTFNGTSGASITYKVDAGSTATAVLTGGTFPLSTGAISSAHTYHLLNAFNPACTTTLNDSVVVTPIPQVWLGTTSSDWNTPSNWACGFVPATGDDISIPSGTPNAPSIAASATGTARNMTLASGAVVTVGAGGSLNITGSSTLNGTVTGAGYATFNGSSAQTITGNFTVNNMKLNNSAGLTVNSTSKVLVKGVLGVSAGALNTGDSVTLYSDSLGTARVDSLPASGASITGQTRVMVYVPGGRRAYRFWSHPFNSYIGLTQAINNIDITGIGGTSNGFTYSASAAPSAFRYNPLVGNSSLASDPGWKPFTSAYTTADSNRLHQYQGIRLFFRGAKGEGLGYLPYTPSSVKVTQSGTLNQGTQTVTLSKGSSNPYQEYNMVGNPYASPVDIGTVVYNALVSGNVVGPAYFVWNPNLGAAGQFQPQFITTATAVPYYIQACNSFQVRAAYNGSALTFLENNKGAAPTTNLFKAAPQYVSLEVLDAKYHPYDMLYVNFNDEATDGNDHNLDATKPFGGADLNFYSIAADNSKMIIDARPYDADKVIPLGIAATTKQDYIIKAANIAVPDGGLLYLHDKLLKQYVMLNQGTEYRFSVSDNAATQGDDRFEISMKPAAAVNTGLKVSIVPNPATDDVNISFVNGKTENVAIRILDLSGVSIYNKSLGAQNTGTVNVQLSKFAAGIYMVELTSGSQKVVQRLVKE